MTHATKEPAVSTMRRPYKVGPRLDKYNELIASERQHLEALQKRFEAERAALSALREESRKLIERAKALAPATDALLKLIEYCDGTITHVVFVPEHAHRAATVMATKDAYETLRADGRKLYVSVFMRDARLEFSAKGATYNDSDWRGNAFFGTSEEDARAQAIAHMRADAASASYIPTRVEKLKRMARFGAELTTDEQATVDSHDAEKRAGELRAAQAAFDKAAAALTKLTGTP